MQTHVSIFHIFTVTLINSKLDVFYCKTRLQTKPEAVGQLLIGVVETLVENAGMLRTLHLSMSKLLYYAGGKSEIMRLPVDVKLLCVHSSHLDEGIICNTTKIFFFFVPSQQTASQTESNQTPLIPKNTTPCLEGEEPVTSFHVTTVYGEN